MDINFGEGGVANCVLSPPYICQGKEHITNNYISKISDLSESKSMSIENEITISNYIKDIKNIEYVKGNSQISLQKWIHKHYSIIDDYCIVDGYMLINESKLQKCNIYPHLKYIIMYSLNGSCLPLKKGDKIIVDDETQKVGVVDSIGAGRISYKEKTGKKKNKPKSINVNLIHRFCGDLFINNKYVLYNNFGTSKLRRKNLKFLLQSLKVLADNSIVHGDIKLENLICNDKGEVRIIDFGGALCLDKVKMNKNDYCKNYLYNDDYINNILLNMFTTYTPRYTPIEVVVLKLLLRNFTRSQIYKYVYDNLDSYFFKKTNTDILDTTIDNLIKNKVQLLNNTYCKDKSILYKYDVYSMGLVFYEICRFLDSTFESIEPTTIKLINNMIEFDYHKRFSIEQCLSMY